MPRDYLNRCQDVLHTTPHNGGRCRVWGGYTHHCHHDGGHNWSHRCVCKTEWDLSHISPLEPDQFWPKRTSEAATQPEDVPHAS